MQEYEAQSLFQRFREEKIPFLPLKGYQTRKLYPHPEARFSCDLDVFYDKKDEKKVGEILKEEGFSFVIENAVHQEWKKDSVTIEMHYSLTEQGSTFEEYYQDVWKRLRLVDGTEYAFKKEDEYVYFLAHAAKHLLGGGIGVRTILDGYMYEKKLSLDKAYLENELKKVGLEKLSTLVQDLASAWFDDGEETPNVKFFGDFVLSSGIYGTRSNYVVTSNEPSKKGTKGRYLLQAIFPRYRNMRSWYPVIKKCPLLLPFVWVYRWFEVLLTRRKSFAKIIKDVDGIEEEHINAIQKIKEMTGLVL